MSFNSQQYHVYFRGDRDTSADPEDVAEQEKAGAPAPCSSSLMFSSALVQDDSLGF